MPQLDVATINQTIRELLDDSSADYADDAYIQTKFNLELTSVVNRLLIYNSDFQEYTIELPGVQAGIPDLGAYMIAGKQLQYLITPREIEWKLPGQDPSFYIDAEGPLNKLRDIPAPGIPALDCWSLKHFAVLLSRTSTALDLRVTGDFLAPPAGASDAQINMAQTCLPVIAHRVARLVGVIRGNQQWVTNYSALADEAFDDVIQISTHQSQDVMQRVGRASEGPSAPNYTGLIR